MERIAFRMQLKPGTLAEYRRRHDAIWPDLVAALHAAGIRDYSIFHDPETDSLFATLVRAPDHAMATLPDLPVMQRWWAAMAPLMDVNPDLSPCVTGLDRVFHLA
jgi:L-rhamnose mutarotase